MIKKILIGLSLVVAGGLITQGVRVTAQSVMTPPGRYISKAEVAKGLDEVIKKGGAGSTVGVLGGFAFPIVPAFTYRRRVAGPNNASIHSTETDKANDTEVVEILDGTGTFEMGGNFVDMNPVYNKKDRSKGITGGVMHDVKPGDFFVIPPGTAHWFPKINGHIDMIEARFEGDVTKGKEKK